ncbi:hypothetical protein ACJX0J_003436 [Zea mays]
MTATIFSILRIPILFEKKSKEKKKERVNNKTGYSFFFLQFFFLEILEKFSFKTDSCFTEEKREFRLFHINGSTFMFLLHEYDIFWTFLIIASLIPILVFWISGLLAPVSEGPEKLSSYESGIEPMGGAWLQFRIRYYMFALVFVVFDVETVFLYPWAMSFDVLGVSVFIEAFIFIPIYLPTNSELGGVLLCRKRKKRAVQSFKLAFEIDQDNAAGLTLQIKSGGLGFHCCHFIMYMSLPKRIILESRLFSGDNKFMFTYTTQFQILFKSREYFDVLFLDETKYLEYNILINSYYTKRASFLFSNLENHIFCLEIYLLTLEILSTYSRLKTKTKKSIKFLADTLL